MSTFPRTASPGWTFFRQWLKNPLAMSAISPSGPQLAKRMLAELPGQARRVVELGGGTGVFTAALLEHGIAPQDLLVLELNQDLARLLKTRFPDATVEHGDARELVSLATRSGYSAGGPVDAVVSGLGMLSMPRALQQEILEAAFSLLGEEGCFIQFTYGHANPVSLELSTRLGLHPRRGDLAWWNLPPATVFVYTRARSTRVSPRTVLP